MLRAETYGPTLFLCSPSQQRIHMCYTCLTFFVLFLLATRHCWEHSSIQPKLKSARNLSLWLLRLASVFACTSNYHLVRDILLADKRAAAFEVVNMTHNLRHFVGSQLDR
jgi:hypothetical protein